MNNSVSPTTGQDLTDKDAVSSTRTAVVKQQPTKHHAARRPHGRAVARLKTAPFAGNLVCTKSSTWIG